MQSAESWRPAVLATWFALAGVGVAQPRPSYEAAVKGFRTYALAGPGTEYYPTMLLAPGQRVTVYGARSGKWVAILPPSGSFSWAPAESVSERPDGSAVVNRDNVVVYVGSNLSEARFVYQVTLGRATPVQIVERATLREGKTDREWIKLLPPDDEVRYIHVDDLVLPSDPASSAPRAANEPALDRPTETPTTSSPNKAPATPAAFGPTDVIPPARPAKGFGMLASRTTSRSSSANQLIAFADLPSGDFDRRIAHLKTQIAAMTSRLPDTWDVEGIQKAMENLETAAASESQQNELAGLREQVKLLKAWQSRYDRILNLRRQTEQRDAALTAVQTRKEAKLPTETRGTRFDGVLRATSTSVDGRPAYALLDDRGMTSCYVIAPPGLRLQPYVGRRVGVLGQTNSRPGLPVPVLAIEQIMPAGNQRP